MYIRGEEILGGWKPRGVSLVEDHAACEKSLASRVDLEISRCLAKGPFEQPEGSEEEYTKLLQYCVSLWKAPSRKSEPVVSTPPVSHLTKDYSSNGTNGFTISDSRRRDWNGI